MIEEWIFSRLTMFPGLAALIGSRCFPEVLPAEVEYPAVRYQRISSPQQGLTHDGGPAGLARPRFQFDAFAVTATEAKETGEQIRLALEGFRDQAAEPRIDGIILADRRGGREPGSNLFRDSLDFFIWHAEATA